MSGSLSVKSELGVGSTFELRVPVRVLPPEEAAEAAAAIEAAEVAETAATEEAEEAQLGRAANFAATDAAAAAASVAARGGAQPMSEEASRRTRQLCKGFRVLVADDHPLNLRLFTRLLQMHGFVVTAVPDGRAALAALQASFATPPPFDVAVLDMDMPHLRGPQVAAAFREWEAQTRPSAMRLPLMCVSSRCERHRLCADEGSVFITQCTDRQCDGGARSGVHGCGVRCCTLRSVRLCCCC